MCGGSTQINYTPEGLRLNGLQSSGATWEADRIHQEDNLVRKAMFQQGGDQRSAARNDDGGSTLCFEALNALYQVWPKSLHRSPTQAFRPVRHNVLRGSIQPVCHFALGCLGPVGDQIVISPTTEEPVAAGPIDFVDSLQSCRRPVGRSPVAVGEVIPGLRSGLGHSIQRKYVR